MGSPLQDPSLTPRALLRSVGRLAALGVSASDSIVVLETLVSELMAVAGGAEVWLYHLDDQRRVVCLAGGCGRIVDSAPPPTWPAVVAEVVSRRADVGPGDVGESAPVHVERARDEGAMAPPVRPAGDPARRWGPPGWQLALPLEGASDVEVVAVLVGVGGICVPREAATVLAQQAQTALGAVRARAAAATDPLTGAMNRRSLLARLAQEISRAHRGIERLGCLVIDLDLFKQVNDRHGHRAGDALLRSAADALRAEFRAFDVVARLGGDEFVVILPGATPQRAVAAAQRALERLARIEGPAHAHVSASIGAACWRGPMGPMDLVHAADGAMLMAKRRGGGRVASADSPPAPR